MEPIKKPSMPASENCNNCKCTTCNVKISSLHLKIRSYELCIIDLQMKIKCEQVKNSVYKNIVETNNFQLDTVLKEQNNELCIDISKYSENHPGDMSIIVKDHMAEIQTYKFKMPYTKPKSAKSSRKKRSEQVSTVDENRLVVEESQRPVDDETGEPRNGKDELKEKSYLEIQKETAWKWASRACASYDLAIEEKDLCRKVAVFQVAEEYHHESIEHAALYEDGGDLLKKVYKELEPYRERATADLQNSLKS